MFFTVNSGLNQFIKVDFLNVTWLVCLLYRLWSPDMHASKQGIWESFVLQTECFILVTWKWSVFEGKARYLKLCCSVVVSIKCSAHCVSVDWLSSDCTFEYCMLCASKSTGDTMKTCICMSLFRLGSNQYAIQEKVTQELTSWAFICSNKDPVQ